MICNLCPRMCGGSGTETENNGFCKMPLLPKIARAQLHFWEEPSISGKNGSGTVFFSGCNLGCVFCQNYEVSHNGLGKTVNYKELAEIFKSLEQKGAHNINLVTPTHYVYAIKKALDIYKPKIPIVYNSNGYERIQTLRELEGYIDIFLLDFKYMSGEKAYLYSKAKDYPEYAKNALSEAYRQQGECIFKDGIMQKGVIVRHLLMPSATKDAVAVFDFVKENTPNVYFSLMSQYVPFGDALNMDVINRKVTKREYEKVLDHILESGFSNVYIQEKQSADNKYIPVFYGE